VPETGTVPALFAGLFDDAAIFPPGNAAMPEAVRGHAEHRAAWYADAVGLFVCSAARLDELAGELHARHSSVELALTVPGGIAGLQHAVGVSLGHERMRLRAVEVPLGEFGPDQAARFLGTFADDLALATYVEVPAARLDAGLAKAIDAAGLRLKLRTGGTVASAFPSEAELAGALVAATAAGPGFKCTAGLHHAVRRRDPVTGFEHHGFLNVLLATEAALRTGDPAAVAATLAEHDPATVVARVRALDPARTAAVRERFDSFGTCSIREPVEDLLALGVLGAPR
jgi:hypothetical protein